jgi:hypothetical protein
LISAVVNRSCFRRKSPRSKVRSAFTFPVSNPCANDFQQALGFAVRSYDTGPRVGEICARNWRTIGVARDNLGDNSGADEAEDRAAQCSVTRPPGL